MRPRQSSTGDRIITTGFPMMEGSSPSFVSRMRATPYPHAARRPDRRRRIDRAAYRGVNSDTFKVISCDSLRACGFRVARQANVKLNVFQHKRAGKHVVVIAEIFMRRVRECLSSNPRLTVGANRASTATFKILKQRIRIFACRPFQHDELLGILHGKRSEHHRLDGAEDGGMRSDSESQREHHDCGERRESADLPGGVTQVFEEVAKEVHVLPIEHAGCVARNYSVRQAPLIAEADRF